MVDQNQVPMTSAGLLGAYGFESKQDFFAATAESWNPHKVKSWLADGIDLVIDERSNYHYFDASGHRLIDLHLNGGTFNLGHRNPELVATLRDALDHVDVGNHHFAAPSRTALAERLLATCHAGMSKVVFGAGGAEINDLAIKSARHATGRMKIVSLRKAFHGTTGFSVAASDGRFSEPFLAEQREHFIQVPANDLRAMEDVLRQGDVAGVLMETIPATNGFAMPATGYLHAVKALCERYGTLYIADEVQTGLMRTGALWAIYQYGVEPDILVTAKGLGGGLYPMSAAVLGHDASRWLEEDGWGHVSTAGGSELGCAVALKVLEISQRPSVAANVEHAADFFANELGALRARLPHWFSDIRQHGLVMGLGFNHPQGAKLVMSEFYKRGGWAIYSNYDLRYLQFKPGLLLTPDDCEVIMDRFTSAVLAAASLAGAR